MLLPFFLQISWIFFIFMNTFVSTDSCPCRLKSDFRSWRCDHLLIISVQSHFSLMLLLRVHFIGCFVAQALPPVWLLLLNKGVILFKKRSDDQWRSIVALTDVICWLAQFDCWAFLCETISLSFLFDTFKYFFNIWPSSLSPDGCFTPDILL